MDVQEAMADRDPWAEAPLWLALRHAQDSRGADKAALMPIL
jgi:hypothetical protein